MHKMQQYYFEESTPCRWGYYLRKHCCEIWSVPLL